MRRRAFRLYADTFPPKYGRSADDVSLTVSGHAERGPADITSGPGERSAGYSSGGRQVPKLKSITLPFGEMCSTIWTLPKIPPPEL